MAFQDFWLQKLTGPLRSRLKLSGERDKIGKVIIEYQGLGGDRIRSKANEYGCRIHREIGLIPSVAMELPLEVIPALAKMTGVFKIWEDTPVYCSPHQAAESPDAGQSYGAAQLLDATMAHDIGYTGRGVVVAILDTGIFPHEDLTTPENRLLVWNDFLHGEPVPYDDHGHGARLAGIIAGNGGQSGEKYRGIAPESLLIGLKVLDQDGIGRLSDVIAGLEWCLHHLGALNIKVINLSLQTRAQGNYQQDPLCRAATKLVEQGVTICAASCGGDADDPAFAGNSPGICPNIIRVGNFNGQKTLTGDEITRLENRTSGFCGYPPDLLASGAEITSLQSGGGYGTLSGASAATSLVSGAAALMIQKWPRIRPEQIKSILKKTARDLGVGVNWQGAGILNLERIFGVSGKKAKKLQLLGPSSLELLPVLLNLIGSNSSRGEEPDSNSNLLSKLLFALLKNMK